MIRDERDFLEPRQARVEFLHEGDEVHVDRVQPRAQLDDVQAPFAALDFADHALILAQAIADVRLTQTPEPAVVPQQSQEYLVLRRMYGLVHGRTEASQGLKTCRIGMYPPDDHR